MDESGNHKQAEQNPVDRIDFDSPFVCTSVILCDCKIHLISNYEDKCTRDSVTG